MSKKLLLSILTITLALSACGGSPGQTDEYDKIAEKVYTIGKALGQSEGSFRKVALSEDDVSFSEEAVDYSGSLGYFQDYEAAVQKFTGKADFNANIVLARVLLENDGQAMHLKNAFSLLYESSLNAVPTKYKWYFKYGYQTSFLDEILKRFETDEGFRTPATLFTVSGFSDLLTDSSDELNGKEKGALEEIAAYEGITNLTTADLAKMQAALDVLIKAF